MSRKGKLPIAIPKGVEAKVTGKKISIKGPKGTLEREFLDAIDVTVEGDNILVSLAKGHEEEKNFHGLWRTLIFNMVEGTTQGFERKLEMKGVGYRATVQGNLLDLSIGVSHPSKLEIPQGIEAKVEKNTTIVLTGIDKQQVGQFAATVRSQRPPEPYQGKGIRYVGEYVRRKAGKSAAKK